MKYSVDVEREYKKSKSKFLRASLLFSSIFALVLLADTLLVIFAKENYTVPLIISITISILFAWFAIFFFSNTYRDINSEYRFYRGYEKGEKQEEEVMFLSQEKEMVFMDGLYVYAVNVQYEQNFIIRDKLIYTFKMTIKTYRRILIDAEKHS